MDIRVCEILQGDKMIDESDPESFEKEIEEELNPEVQFNKELGIEEEREGEQDYETERQKHRRVGDAFEVETLLKLREKFPGIEFRRLRNYSQTAYDIECDYCLFDCVSVDKSNRLITDHKNRMLRHKKEAKDKRLIGLIVFKYNDLFYSLNVNSKFFQKYKRPPITESLLRACVLPPIPAVETKPEPKQEEQPKESVEQPKNKPNLFKILEALDKDLWYSIDNYSRYKVVELLELYKSYPVKMRSESPTEDKVLGDILIDCIDSKGEEKVFRYKFPKPEKPKIGIRYGYNYDT